jgi:hypothetical protein
MTKPFGSRYILQLEQGIGRSVAADVNRVNEAYSHFHSTTTAKLRSAHTEAEPSY